MDPLSTLLRDTQHGVLNVSMQLLRAALAHVLSHLLDTLTFKIFGEDLVVYEDLVRDVQRASHSKSPTRRWKHPIFGFSIGAARESKSADS